MQKSEKNSLSWHEDYLPMEEGDIAPVGKNAVPARELKLRPDTDDIAPVRKDISPAGEDIAPVRSDLKRSSGIDDDFPIAEKDKKKAGENKLRKKGTPEQKKIAEVLDTEPKPENKRKRLWAKFKANVFDKGAVFEDLSLETKNRELMGKWNYILSSDARAQHLIGKGKTGVTQSLYDIQERVGKTGKTKDFCDYLYNLHNIDRMTLSERFPAELDVETKEEIRPAMENKPVFGEDVTADDSREKVKKYEAENPQFKKFAKEVYAYNRYLRQLLVENNVISKETAELWEKMYPHYVPIRRENESGIGVNVPLDSRRTGVNTPVQRATGGSSDILPLFGTMALRTKQTYKAIAKNNFGLELLNTLGTTDSNSITNVDEIIDSIETQESLLQKGKNGGYPTFTVFKNGEKVTFEITEDMYDALKPVSSSSLLSETFKPLNKLNKFHRGLLTEYNPVFIMTNTIKDIQDILINSQHAAKTYLKIPEAYAQIIKKGYWYEEYIANGGEQNSYFNDGTNTFETKSKDISKVMTFPFDAVSSLNNIVEMAPRLAEYIASREAGRSAEVSMLDAARVTTNFAAGGDFTKFLNRNGATFLNASVQGALQQVRNIKEAKANGLKGWINLAAKYAAAGIPAMILNALLWGDDEEYEELSDYIKQNYYIVGKYGDGKFVRIPKGRTMAVIQDAFNQVANAVTGDDEVDLMSFLDLAVSNLAPNNPIDNNVLSPLVQVANNKTWYGEDLVSERLQDLPEAEQYDEGTDALSKWLGEKINYSPVKINYLLDQYSGGLGDMLLPMMTPKAESGDSTFGGKLIAPMKSKFTADSVMNNRNISDFYDLKDELTVNANASGATHEDILKNKYINSINADISDLYKAKREAQNSDLPDDEKYAEVRSIQKQINDLAGESMTAYKDIAFSGPYARVGKLYYKLSNKGKWEKLSDEQLEKLDISTPEYWSSEVENGSSNYDPENYTVAGVVGGFEAYKKYSDAISAIKADGGSRKEKVLSYINGLDLDYGQKLMLFKSEYRSDTRFDYRILAYLGEREDLSYEQLTYILESLGLDKYRVRFTEQTKGGVFR